MTQRTVAVRLFAHVQPYVAGMRQAQDATAKVAGSTEDLNAGAKRQSTEMDHVGSTIRGRVLPALAGVVGGMQLADKTFRAGFTRLTNLEDAEKRFSQMGLTVGETDDLMAGLNDTLIDTPFKLDSGADAMSRFVASGMDIDDVNTNFALMADAAAFAQVPLSQLTEIWERIQSEGKLTGETLRMLQVRGIPALSLLADAAGVTEAQFRDMISTGQVEAEVFFDLWAQGAKGFGDDNIVMEGAAKSMGDTVSGAAANAETALARLGAAVLEDFMPAMRAGFDGLRDEINGVIERWEFATGLLQDAGSLIPDDLLPGSDDAEDQEGFWSRAFNAAKQGAGDIINSVLPVAGVWDLIQDGTDVVDELGDSAEETGEETASFIDRLRAGAEEQMPVFLDALLQNDQALAAMGIDAEEAREAVAGLGNASEEAGEQHSTAAERLQEYIDATKAATDPVFGMLDAVQKVDEAQRAYNEAVDEHGPKSEEATQAGFDLAEAIAAAEVAAIDGDLSFDEFTDKLDAWAEQGLIDEEVAGILGEAIAGLRGEAEDYAGPYNADIDARHTEQARRKLQGVQDSAQSIPQQRTVNVNTSGTFHTRNLLNGVRATVLSIPTSRTIRIGMSGPGAAVGVQGSPQGHSGGLVTKSGFRRFHGGGQAMGGDGAAMRANLAPDEVPAILQTREVVSSRAQVSQVRAGMHMLGRALSPMLLGRPVAAGSFHNGGAVGGGKMEFRHTFVGSGGAGAALADHFNYLLRQGEINIKTEAVQR